MNRPKKESYKPFDLGGDIGLAKWMLDYAAALDKYVDHLESEKVSEKSSDICSIIDRSNPETEIEYQRDLIAELINMQLNPSHSNQEWKDQVISVAKEKGYGRD